MPRSSTVSVALATALAAAMVAPARAQSLDSLVVRLGAISAVTGFEDALADTLLQLVPMARRDRAGNVLLVRGSGPPIRLAACPMDEMGYVVGSITSEGYLTLRRVGGTNVGPLYDQFLEGQRITVQGRRGLVPGVVGVRSTHLARGRPAGDDPPFALDNAYVDVGAQNPLGVAALGIQVLAPVTRAKRVHRYGEHGGLLAAPWIAQRAACAALVAAANQLAAPTSGTIIVAFTARRHFNNDGLAFLTVAFPGAEVLSLGGTAATAFGSGPAPEASTTSTAWALPARYARTPVETVALSDVAQLPTRIVAWLGGAR